MRRLTDDEIRDFPLDEIEPYLEAHPDEVQRFANFFAESSPNPTKQVTLFLCDGTVESCPKTNCYKCGHECRHTTDKAHALNSEPHNFLPDLQGNLWEKSTENLK